jgi:hypothetical protein
MSILLLCSRLAAAQYSAVFEDPSTNSKYSDFYVGQTQAGGAIARPTATTAYSYQIKLYRLASNAVSGYVDLFVGTGATQLSSPALTASSHINVTNATWLPVYTTSGQSGFEYTYLTGNFSVSAAQAATTSGIYAQFFSTKKTTSNPLGNPVGEEVSQPVLFDVTPLPTTGGGTSTPIVYDQCIPVGTKPARLNARLSTINNDFAINNDRYVWQSSTDNINWVDVSATIYGVYDPPIANQTTYYRVKSESKDDCTAIFFFCGWREYSMSGVFTVNVLVPAPVPVQATYTTCGSGPLNIGIVPVPNAISYNWVSEDATWKINGQGSSITTSGLSSSAVQLVPPSNVALGSYRFHVTANSSGSCGTSNAGEALITVDVTTTAILVPNGARWQKAATAACDGRYNLVAEIVPGASPSGYSARASNGSVVKGIYSPTSTKVVFPFEEYGPQTLSVQITATSSCGTSTGNVAPYAIPDVPAKCYSGGGPRGRLSAYPNPATEQVEVATDEQAAQVTFFDATGTVRKAVRLRAGTTHNSINVHDMPAGVYHVRIAVDGQVPVDHQMVIQH